MKPNSRNNARKQRVGKGSAAPLNKNKNKTLAIVTPPVNMGAVYQNRGAQGGSAFKISHSELFTSVQTGANRANRCYGFRIQPTDSSMFPWLSQIADRFDKYRFTALSFTYTSLLGTSSPGVVAMAVDYDPHDLAPMSADQDGRQQIMSHVDAQQHPIWQPFTMKIPSSALQKAGERWVRNWEGEEQVEARTADLGVLYLGLFGVRDVYGFENSIWVGDVSVSYTIELMMPQLNRPAEQSGPQIIDITERFEGTTPRPTADPLIELPTDRDMLSGKSPLTPLLGTTIHAVTEVTDNGPQLLEYKMATVANSQEGTLGVLEIKDDFEGAIEVDLLSMPKNALDTEHEPLYPFDLISLKRIGETDDYEFSQLSPVQPDGPSGYATQQDVVIPTMWSEIKDVFEDGALEAGAVIKRYVWQCVGTWLKGQLLTLFYGSLDTLIGYTAAHIRVSPRTQLPRIELARRKSYRNIDLRLLPPNKQAFPKELKHPTVSRIPDKAPPQQGAALRPSNPPPPSSPGNCQKTLGARRPN